MKTIVALSTPQFTSAIHIIRVSGDKCYQCVSKISKQKIVKKGYIIQKVDLFDGEQKIDEVLLNKFVAPKSYTGEDLIEINCHGSLYVANKIISLLIKNGCETAKNGEFTKRAFLNNKISLIQSEAINNLINSSNDLAIKIALNGLDNKTNDQLSIIRNNIFKILGQVEVDIDYPEYEQTPDVSKKEISKIFHDSILSMNDIISSSNKVVRVKNGINVAIVGKPNVGKSSLLNALLKEDRAIVSNIPGTTRDTIESSVIINGLKFNFVDTAGIRTSKNIIERIGIKKTKQAVDNADLTLVLIDNSKPITNEDKEIINSIEENAIIVLNKNDKKSVNKIEGIKISAKTNSINELIKYLSNYKNFNSIDLKNKLILQTQQSINLLEHSLVNLEQAEEIFKSNSHHELAANNLHECVDSLDKILGLTNDLSFVDELFSKFCR